jgi:hypothetical protein
MIMLRLIIAFLITSASLADADDSRPSLLAEPVNELVAKFGESSDVLYLSLASRRCASLLHLLQEVVVKNTQQEFLTGVPELLFTSSAQLIAFKLLERGVTVNDAEIKKINKEVSDDYVAFADAYRDRIDANRKSAGDMLAGDDLLTSDLDQCKRISPLVSSALVRNK